MIILTWLKNTDCAAATQSFKSSGKKKKKNRFDMNSDLIRKYSFR